jgi:hypothetical protein
MVGQIRLIRFVYITTYIINSASNMFFFPDRKDFNPAAI